MGPFVCLPPQIDTRTSVAVSVAAIQMRCCRRSVGLLLVLHFRTSWLVFYASDCLSVWPFVCRTVCVRMCRENPVLPLWFCAAVVAVTASTRACILQTDTMWWQSVQSALANRHRQGLLNIPWRHREILLQRRNELSYGSVCVSWLHLMVLLLVVVAHHHMAPMYCTGTNTPMRTRELVNLLAVWVVFCRVCGTGDDGN